MTLSKTKIEVLKTLKAGPKGHVDNRVAWSLAKAGLIAKVLISHRYPESYPEWEWSWALTLEGWEALHKAGK